MAIKSIEELKARHQRELDGLVKQHALAAGLPRQPEFITSPESRAPWVTYKAPDFGALDLFKEFAAALPILSVAVATDGSCTVVEPLETMDKKYREGTVRCEGLCAELNSTFIYSERGSSILSMKLVFFVKTSESVLRICVDIGEGSGYSPRYWRLAPKATNPNAKLYRTREYRPHADLKGMSHHQVHYGGSDSSRNDLYLWMADNFDPDTGVCDGFSHFEGVFQNIIDNFQV